MQKMSWNRIMLAGLLGLVGCAHTVRIESDPSGASIKRGRTVIGVTPADVSVKWMPFVSIPITLDAPGRRTMVIDLADDMSVWRWTKEGLLFRYGKLSGRVPRETHKALFVRHHGPAGTWAPEDVK